MSQGASARLMPYECRIANKTYKAPLFATICSSKDNGPE
jgi:hypothetical protein